MKETEKKYPEGHFIGMWIGIGVAIFAGLGIPLSIILKMPAFMGIAPALGVSVGVAIGVSIEEKRKKEGKIRPLTKQEKNQRKIVLFAGIALLMAGVAIFLIRYFS